MYPTDLYKTIEMLLLNIFMVNTYIFLYVNSILMLVEFRVIV